MPTLTIDGQQVTVEAGTTVIQAAEKLGIYIPRYCYHPGLSIAGSCRMCMVDIEKNPKLQIGCYTVATDGMVVNTANDKVKLARKHMLEFLLTNHPLDCPVCDQSGECDLQNFYMEFGRYESRFFEDKIKKKKAAPLGPHVMLDQERCILCSRCTRFTEEVSKSNELGIFNRGNRSVVDLHPGKVLDNPYSGNVIDICPVGALTEREFRFKCRVWYLASEKSVCTGCSRGCNVWIHYNGSHRDYKAGGRRVQRLKPRFNPAVNHWWMCDEGRFGFEFIDQNRIEFPHLRRGSRLEAVDWPDAFTASASAIRAAIQQYGPESVGVVVSPKQSNEDLLMVRKVFKDGLGVTQFASRNPAEKPGFEDDFLVKADKNPNTEGVRQLGLAGDATGLLQKAAAGEIKVLYVFEHDISDGVELDKVEFLIYQGSNWNPTAQAAHVVLASATHAERAGTFTNFEGRVQRFRQALPPLEDSRADLGILSGLAGQLGLDQGPATVEQLFEEWFGRPLESLEEYGEEMTAPAV